MAPQLRSYASAAGKKPTQEPAKKQCNQFCCSTFAAFHDVPVTGTHNLTNSIHRLFAPSRFPQTHSYAVLKPSLQLATRLLNQDSAIKHLLVMLYGDLDLHVGDMKTGARMKTSFEAVVDSDQTPSKAVPKPDETRLQDEQGSLRDDSVQSSLNAISKPDQPSQNLDDGLDSWRDNNGVALWPYVSRYPTPEQKGELTGDMRQKFNTLLMNAANSKLITFHFEESHGSGAATFPMKGCLTPSQSEKFPRGCRCEIALSQQSYDTINKYQDSENPVKRDDVLCCRVQLAINLVHEIGHALSFLVEGLRGHDCFREDCDLAEAGFALENAIFGGLLKPSVSLITSRKGEFCPDSKKRPAPIRWWVLYEWPSGIVQAEYQQKGYRIGSRKVNRMKSAKIQRVRTEYVEEMLQDRFWSPTVKKEGLQVPTEGDWFAFWNGQAPEVHSVQPWLSIAEHNEIQRWVSGQDR